jgi:2-amino-4-hydroxy-6-hydroxymethyldihydropteridine diphosphokinase
MEIHDEPGLVVPHPRFRRRRFVLEPLAEIAADWIDPVTGRTIDELLRTVDS